MAGFTVDFAAAAKRQLEKLPNAARRRVTVAIDALAENPRPRGATLLAAMGGTWRIRVGDYRVLYEIQDDRLLVLVVRVGHRRDVYRGRRISEASAPYEAIVDWPQPHGGRSWTREALYPDQTG